jgi:glycosyltransferase involved in cell wall biosynthesis
MQPVVSVIIPTYNRANLLKYSIQSVLSQTFKHFEIIIINNYSNDNTLEVINSYNDNRIKIINYKNNGIIAKSRNQGLIQSSGRYIGFLDDDDLWCPDKLENQIKYMESNPEIDITYSNAVVIDEHGIKKGLLMDPERAKSGKVFLELIKDPFVPVLTVLMRRKVFETNGLLNEDLTMRAAEDFEYWLRASLKFNFGYIDKPMALYRIHSQSASMAINRPLLRQKVLQSFINNPDVPEKYFENIIYNIDRLNADVAVYYWSNSDKQSAKTYAKRYFLSNFKRIKLLHIIIGLLLYIAVNFSYNLFEEILIYVVRIRKHLNF